MARKVPKEWMTYDYIDPVKFVTEHQRIRAAVSASKTPEKLKNLRTRKLSPKREAWDAGVFCYLLREKTGKELYFSPVEKDDYDAIFTWKEGITQLFAPVQMKEVVPDSLNPSQTIRDVLYGLKKYATSSDLIVAIKINRNEHIEASSVLTDGLPVPEVWLFGATEPSEKSWGLLYKVGTKFELTQHELPKA